MKAPRVQVPAGQVSWDGSLPWLLAAAPPFPEERADSCTIDTA